ncbi:autotransporter assembly complex protein TamA [Elioraea rosea]|uniref:autotransporter assembly complex protein TamA n=1 Tax=Elioraea rosea TaxID=2492390 RepID=UPI0013155C61|nr:autotransporter assembly complex family protein [Elioraea rosea]
MVAALLVCVAQVAALAQGIERYTTEIVDTGDSEIDDAITASSLLVSLQAEPIPSAAILIARARADAERAATVLRALGYFDGSVRVTLAGTPLDDVSLPARLAGASGPIPVVMTITSGQRTRIARVAVLGQDERPLEAGFTAERLAEVVDLTEGAPARGADLLAAENRVLAALRQRGFAHAETLPRSLVRDPATATLSVTFRFDPGSRVRIGRITVEGLDRVEPSLVAARVAPSEGKLLTPAEIEATRRSLLALGTFAVVRARVAPERRADGVADVTFTVTERLPRVVSLRGAYASSEGASVGASWAHRNLFGRAERLEVSGEVSGLAERGFEDLGYRLGLIFTKPDTFRLNQTFSFNAAVLREVTDAYRKESVGGGVMIRRPLIPFLTGGLGATLSQSRITEAGVTNDYTLLGLPATVLWNDTNDGLNRTRGTRAEATLTPYPVAIGSVSGLTTLRVDASHYASLASEARTLLALRAQFGAAFGASTDDLPADLRLYAGGSGTIRGFAYQSIGPLDDSGRPLGGSTLLAGTIEVRQRITEQWGVVGFVDSGGVGGNRAPEWPDRIATGVGVGVRYYTAIGPLRADIAIPVSGKREGDAGWQVYFGIGQAF